MGFVGQDLFVPKIIAVENLPGFPAVKEFWKSVKNWQSYRYEFDVLLFGGHCVWSICSGLTAAAAAAAEMMSYANDDDDWKKF